MAILFIIVSLLLIGYAASCNAKMDTVKDHWSISIYAANKVKYDDQWFDPRVSWANKNLSNFHILIQLANKYLPSLVFDYLEHRKKAWTPLSDFWHFEKAKMICALIGSAVFTFIAGCFLRDTFWGFISAWVVIYYIGAGVVWNEIFNLYYDRKLVTKNFKKQWLWIK